uniref:CCAAT-binding factor domain-containing protein n=1 Tax=Anopheles quadriannulatus TaxID=34691 RepID=A0A182XBN4_ANOQN
MYTPPRIRRVSVCRETIPAMPIVLLMLALLHTAYGTNYRIDLTSSGSVVLGLNQTIEFSAVLYTDGKLEKDDYVVDWSDNTYPQHKLEGVTSKIPRFNWTVMYAHPVKPGTYQATITVKKTFVVIPYELKSATISFNLTSMLNGQLMLTQNDTVVNSTYVSSTLPLNQTIALSESDQRALSRAAYVQTFWFINCQYIGTSDELSTLSNFTQENSTYTVEALVVASFEKYEHDDNDVHAYTSYNDIIHHHTCHYYQHYTQVDHQHDKVAGDIILPDVSKETVMEASPNQDPFLRIAKKSDRFYNLEDARQPYICDNSSMVAPDPKKVYGYFQRTFTVQHPIARFNVSGQQWVRQGQPVDLVFQCSGTPPFEFCYNLNHGQHNMTSNETCKSEWEPSHTAECRYKIHRFFFTNDQYSIVIFVRNRVSNYFTQIGIQFYENQPKSQLSVIIVPIAFGLLAVLMVVFGMAYYIQNRDRFIVEVADFNFGDTSSLDDDMEYKTFHQRLVDSLRDSASIALKDKAEESFKVTVFEPKKAALQKKRSRPPPPPKKDDSEKNKSGDDDDDNDDDEDDIDDIFSDAPRKKPKRKEDPTVFDMTKARRDIMNLGFSGFDKESKHQANVRLAIKLGAKPPKNQYRNYREILEEKKAAKEVEEDTATKRRQGQLAYGAIQSYNKNQQRKREKQRNPNAIMKHYGIAKPRKRKMSLPFAPSSAQIPSGKAVSKQLKKKAAEFLACTRATSTLVEILEYFKECLARKAPITPCLLTLEYLFTELIRRGDIRPADTGAQNNVPLAKDSQTNLKQWLQAHYGEAFDMIIDGMHHEKEGEASQALAAAMKLLAVESHHRPEADQFPMARLKQILTAMLSTECLNKHLFNRFLEYASYLDVIFYCWKTVPSLVPRSGAPPSDAFKHNFLLLLDAILFGKEKMKEADNVLCVPLGDGFDYTLVRKQINRTWGFVMNWQHSVGVHEQLLILLLEKVFIHLDKPVLLTDFLMDSLDVGGTVSVLALQGVFVLIQQHNLTYPNIYEKLYSMFEPEIFHTKFKARLFYLADIFLSSSHLPEGLVAAFVKRLARLSLIAPPQDIVIILRFIGNLILRHPALKRLIFHPTGGEASSDPYVMEERDPMKSKALESSLWEIAALQNHVLPSVASAARFISNPLPSVEWDLSEVLEISENDIFHKEMMSKTQDFFVNIDRPTGMFGYCGGQVASQCWKLF